MIPSITVAYTITRTTPPTKILKDLLPLFIMPLWSDCYPVSCNVCDRETHLSYASLFAQASLSESNIALLRELKARRFLSGLTLEIPFYSPIAV